MKEKAAASSYLGATARKGRGNKPRGPAKGDLHKDELHLHEDPGERARTCSSEGQTSRPPLLFAAGFGEEAKHAIPGQAAAFASPARS